MSCRCVCHDLTSFDGIPFGIRADDRSGVYTDWSGMEPIYNDEPIPYNYQGRSVRELIGFSPAQVTWRIDIACRHRYYDLLARLGTVSDLVVLAGYQSLAGTQTTLGNPPQVYEVLDQVLLRAMPVREFHPDGWIEAEVVFERAFSPVSRLATVEES